MATSLPSLMKPVIVRWSPVGCDSVVVSVASEARPAPWMRMPYCSVQKRGTGVYGRELSRPTRRFSAAARPISTALSQCSTRRWTPPKRRLGQRATSPAATMSVPPTTWQLGSHMSPSSRTRPEPRSQDTEGTEPTARTTTAANSTWPSDRWMAMPLAWRIQCRIFTPSASRVPLARCVSVT